MRHRSSRSTLLVFCYDRQRDITRERELLHAPILRAQGRDLRREEITTGVSRQMVERSELSRTRAPRSKRIEELKRAPVEDHDLRLAPICHIEIALVRVWRERESRRRLPVTAVRRMTLTPDE